MRLARRFYNCEKGAPEYNWNYVRKTKLPQLPREIGKNLRENFIFILPRAHTAGSFSALLLIVRGSRRKKGGQGDLEKKGEIFVHILTLSLSCATLLPSLMRTALFSICPRWGEKTVRDALYATMRWYFFSALLFFPLSLAPLSCRGESLYSSSDLFSIFIRGSFDTPLREAPSLTHTRPAERVSFFHRATSRARNFQNKRAEFFSDIFGELSLDLAHEFSDFSVKKLFCEKSDLMRLVQIYPTFFSVSRHIFICLKRNTLKKNVGITTSIYTALLLSCARRTFPSSLGI